MLKGTTKERKAAFCIIKLDDGLKSHKNGWHSKRSVDSNEKISLKCQRNLAKIVEMRNIEFRKTVRKICPMSENQFFRKETLLELVLKNEKPQMLKKTISNIPLHLIFKWPSYMTLFSTNNFRKNFWANFFNKYTKSPVNNGCRCSNSE
jgi:hypothetical protein